MHTGTRMGFALLLLATPVWADIYRCPGLGGQPVYQDRPCRDDRPPVIDTQPPRPSVPVPSLSVPPTAPRPVHDIPPVSTPPPQVPSSSQAEPVDTLQFAGIATGMTEAEVRQRLGPPATITDAPRLLVPIPGVRPIAYQEVQRTIWVYPGTRQVMETRIVSVNGRVESKSKTR